MKTLCGIKRVCYYFIIFLIVFIFIILPLFFPFFSIVVYIFITFLYFITNIIKIFLFFVGFKLYNIDNYYKKDNLQIFDSELPLYSILLPVRKEKDFVLRSLLTSIYNLDYPQTKLDIKLIVDNNDLETIKICKKLLSEFVFDLIIVPVFKIMSKPISCNYALQFIKGEYLTIYDAEDNPEKYQLKKAVQRFIELDNNYICLQASLNYYNKYENFITYCFSLEYSMWFDYTIKAISKFSSFFPLGGTSNHFKVNKLIELGGWDGYNVTEDAELGVRILRAGYKISLLNSITEEESPITIKAWLKQRSRWIKGFIQTFCEHTILRKPIGIKTKIKFNSIFSLNIIDIIIYFSFIIMSFFFFISIIAIFFNHIFILQLKEFKYLEFIIYFNLLSFFFIIYGSFILITLKNKIKLKPLYFICFPLYWLLHYIGAYYAIKSLIQSPFYWAKTEHGVSKTNLIKKTYNQINNKS